MSSLTHWFELGDGEWTDNVSLKFSPFNKHHSEVQEYRARLKTVYDLADVLQDTDAWVDMFEAALPDVFSKLAQGVFVGDNRETLEIDCKSREDAEAFRLLLSQLLEDEAKVVATLRGNA